MDGANSGFAILVTRLHGQYQTFTLVGLGRKSYCVLSQANI